MVVGLAPIGCAPHYLWMYKSRNGECVEEINDMITEFNFVMRYMVQELGQELSGSSIIFCDISEGSMDILKNHEKYGETISSLCDIDFWHWHLAPNSHLNHNLSRFYCHK